MHLPNTVQKQGSQMNWNRIGIYITERLRGVPVELIELHWPGERAGTKLTPAASYRNIVKDNGITAL